MSSDGMYDTYLHDTMVSQFGRRRGPSWRADKQWFALGDKNTESILKQGAKEVADRRETLRNENGMTLNKDMRYMGSIPTEIAFANPELLYDPEAARRFFKDFKAYSSKK